MGTEALLPFFMTIVMESFCTKRPLFSISNDALQIFLYYDELETCNPLGSNVRYVYVFC